MAKGSIPLSVQLIRATATAFRAACKGIADLRREQPLCVAFIRAVAELLKTTLEGITGLVEALVRSRPK